MRRWLCLALLLFPLAAMAADTSTVVEVEDYLQYNLNGWKDSFRCLKITWQGDDSDCTKSNVTIPALKGRIVMVTTDPGSTAPADNYDLTLLNSEGEDVMGGLLANRHTTTTQSVIPLAGALAIPGGRPVYGPLTMTFTATANANCNGEVFVYYVE